MNIKKGISLIAFGFAFVLVNLTLTLNGRSICVTPDFVGWILFFMSFDLLGSYIADKAYMKWISLILAIVTGAIWMLKIAAPEMNTSILTTAATVVSVFYMYILFNVLEMVAHDHAPQREATIRMLKILYLVMYVLFVVFSMLTLASQNENLALLAGLVGAVTLVCAIVIALVLFRFRKEVKES